MPTFGEEDWLRLKDVFETARALPAERRPSYLATACHDNPALRLEVEELLASYEGAATFLETPAASIDENIGTSGEPGLPARIGRYRITDTLGEGGMGVVYSALDERLERPIALKVLRHERAADSMARERFWREARLAASVNHPHICQLYEIGESEGRLFIAMERLQGEPLAARLNRGAIPITEAVRIGLEILDALEALHDRGITHRDLKPSNVFLTPHGAKVLDFGVSLGQTGDDTQRSLTSPGVILGTPKYMAPEQALGNVATPSADLFAVGAILYEMLSGIAAFEAESVHGIVDKVLHGDVPTLAGTPAVAAADRVIHRALSKAATERYASAAAMAADLRTALVVGGSESHRAARPVTRLMVLPFRLLKPDAEIDFLAFSLADAVTNSLSSLESLVVRSTLAAARFASNPPDLHTIADEAKVDVVLTGTLLRAGETLRVSAQLLEAPSGTVLWSHSAQVGLGDIFQLQDTLARQIVESLALPLSSRERRAFGHDVPASAKAYEFYLRANQLAGKLNITASLARDLYLECLREDPHFAPAWARLGRVYRVLGKFGDADAAQNLSRAEAAFVRALEINPDLSVAHNLYSYLEIDSGRAENALIRLVGRAQRRTSDPEIFAGLVHACRYCGLLDASLAADEQARRFDRLIITSVTNTYFHLGDYQRALDTVRGTGEPITSVQALMMLGREEEAREKLRNTEAIEVATPRRWCESLRLLLEGRRVEGLAATEAILPDGYRDPESLYFVARQLIFFGSAVNGMPLLARAVDEGFFCFTALARDPWLDSVRSAPAFTKILSHAESRSRDTLAAFLEAGGDRLVGWIRGSALL